MGSDATTNMTTTPPRSKHDPAALKFTAVKVDVSALTRRCKCKAFVISSQTTSRDLTDMVLRKLKIDVKGHVMGTCLLGQTTDGEGRKALEPDDRIVGIYGSKHRKTLTFDLVPADIVKGYCVPVNVDDVDGIKAGNIMEHNTNGMTLPGYKKTDVNYNLGIGSGFLTSTPNPDNCESLGSTLDSGFMIHYEPFTNDVRQKRPPVRSRSFEIARDNGYKLDMSSGNASDSGMVGNGAGHYQAEKLTEDQEYTQHTSLRDGFQILQSKNSAWTPFTRHASDGIIKGLSLQHFQSTSSVPDVSKHATVPEKPNGSSSLVRRRSLPRMTVSQEQLEEKKRSVTDLFSLKLQEYVKKTRTSSVDKDIITRAFTTERPLLQNNRDDDVVSVTSQEVAEILSSASPMKPYEDEATDSEKSPNDESPNEIVSRPKNGDEELAITPKNIFCPVTGNKIPRRHSVGKGHEGHSNDKKKDKRIIGDFVEQSMQQFLNNSPVSVNGSNEGYTDRHSDARRAYVSTGPVVNSSNAPEPTGLHVTSQKIDQRGIPLFTLLTTHILAPVMIRRNRELSPHKQIGVRLCDVTYAKCVRHVIRHWAINSRHFTIEQNLSERMLVAVGGIDRRTTVILAGKLFRGDIVVEVNGMSSLTRTARDVTSTMILSDVVSVVVARSRLNMERAQSP